MRHRRPTVDLHNVNAHRAHLCPSLCDYPKLKKFYVTFLLHLDLILMVFRLLSLVAETTSPFLYRYILILVSAGVAGAHSVYTLHLHWLQCLVIGCVCVEL